MEGVRGNMVINEKMQEELNGQINAELYSGYLYLSMATYFAQINLKGFANWMRMQELEEKIHAMLIYDYVISRGGRVYLKAIDGPPVEWDSPLAAAKAAYNHECKVSKMIDGLLDVAMGFKDNATINFLQWFVKEQVEEEEQTMEMVQRLEFIGDDKSQLFMYDQELAARPEPVPPAAAVQAAN